MISNRNIPKSYDDDKSLDNDVGDQVLGGWGLELDTLSFWSFHTRHNLVKQKKIIIIIIITRPTGRQNPLNTEIITFVPNRLTYRQFLFIINKFPTSEIIMARTVMAATIMKGRAPPYSMVTPM